MSNFNFILLVVFQKTHRPLLYQSIAKRMQTNRTKLNSAVTNDKKSDIYIKMPVFHSPAKSVELI